MLSGIKHVKHFTFIREASDGECDSPRREHLRGRPRFPRRPAVMATNTASSTPSPPPANAERTTNPLAAFIAANASSLKAMSSNANSSSTPNANSPHANQSSNATSLHATAHNATSLSSNASANSAHANESADANSLNAMQPLNANSLVSMGTHATASNSSCTDTGKETMIYKLC